MKFPWLTKEEKVLYYFLDKILVILPLIWRIVSIIVYLFCGLGAIFLLIALIGGDFSTAIELFVQVLVLLIFAGIVEVYAIPIKLPKWRNKLQDKIKNSERLFNK